MNIFVDTSALYALMDADDRNHTRAGSFWREALLRPAGLYCSNYVLVESLALIQRRLGIAAVHLFLEAIVPLLQVQWITADQHAVAVSALLAAGRRDLSLVDCSSFEVMRQVGVADVFTFDRHFSDLGFACHP
jgi:predicted nucleic acid-binding protein